MKLEGISTYRNELMGISAIMILICHMVGNNVMMPHLLAKIADNGQLGVDMFLTLSGLGIYYSLSKRPEILPWYWKRIKKIYVPFLLFAIPYLAVKIALRESDFSVVLPFIFNTWIFGGDGAWYLSLLILLYLISPIFFNISLQKNGEIKLLIISVLTMLLCALPDVVDTNFCIAFRRAPSYIMGFIIAREIKHDNSVDFKNILIALVAFVLMQVFMRSCYSRWIIILPLLLVLECSIQKIKTINIAFAFMGTISLESYLANIFLGDILNHKSWMICCMDLSYGHYLEYAVVLIFGLFIAYYVHKASDRILNILR